MALRVQGLSLATSVICLLQAEKGSQRLKFCPQLSAAFKDPVRRLKTLKPPLRQWKRLDRRCWPEQTLETSIASHRSQESTQDVRQLEERRPIALTRRYLRTRAVACPDCVETSWGESFLGKETRSGGDEEPSQQSSEELLLTCTTFNVLAPIYKRLGNEEVRESSFKEEWYSRNKHILSTLLAKRSSIICLQELWLANPELVSMYEDALHEEGYKVLKLPRTNNRGDGLLTAVKTNRLEVVHHEDLLFNDCGDRVAQFVRLRSTNHNPHEREGNLEMLVVNTHLLFPHDSTSSFIRLRQVNKVLEHLEEYKARHGLGPIPILLCGDLNGSKQGQVSKFLRSQGFESSYDIAHNYPDNDERWISHRNHKGVVCGVDFIWLLNPNEQRSPLSADWKAAVFQFLGSKLREIGYTDQRQAFSFFCCPSDEEEDIEEQEKDRLIEAKFGQASAEGQAWANKPSDVITIADFQSVISRLGQEMGLTSTELKQLLDSADIDGNGVVDYQEFQAVVSRLAEAPKALNGHEEKDSRAVSPGDHSCHRTVGFEVKDATLFPPETGNGIWPKDWSLSDHSMLTAVFSPKELSPDDNEFCFS